MILFSSLRSDEFVHNVSFFFFFWWTLDCLFNKTNSWIFFLDLLSVQLKEEEEKKRFALPGSRPWKLYINLDFSSNPFRKMFDFCLCVRILFFFFSNNKWQLHSLVIKSKLIRLHLLDHIFASFGIILNLKKFSFIDFHFFLRKISEQPIMNREKKT